MKPRAVAIHARIYGLEDFHSQKRSSRQDVQRITASLVEACLQVKSQYCPCSGADRFDAGVLATGGSRKHTDKAQNCNHQTAHGPGSFLVQKCNREDSTLDSRQEAVNAELRTESRIVHLRAVAYHKVTLCPCQKPSWLAIKRNKPRSASDISE